MKKKTLTAVLPLLTLALSSCGTTIQYKEHLDDYVYAMKFHENFNVLQLTDIHWSYDSSTCASKTYLEKVIKESDSHIKKAQGASAKIDLIEITGDQFMLANAYHVETFMKFFEEQAEKYGFMYTVIWGNHDRHGSARTGLRLALHAAMQGRRLGEVHHRQPQDDGAADGHGGFRPQRLADAGHRQAEEHAHCPDGI
jgi:metallophosphoesterase superfamily enzyme